jgi:hypothetical protein
MSGWPLALTGSVQISQQRPALGENSKDARVPPSGDQEAGIWKAPTPRVNGFMLPVPLEGSQLSPRPPLVRLQVTIFALGVHTGSLQPAGGKVRDVIVPRARS